ncbi:MAG: glycosyltransferase family 2 protein [Nitrospirae bacterium]|nr:glycosyltransferase family 2 protein [Nitrospirota bacterium]
MKESKSPLSVAIITKNEEEMLPDCLNSVSFADDVVVVDSGSTDNTVEIAQDFGARTFIEEWKGYGPQKNSAVSKCKHDWVLIIDADERIPSETKEVILKILTNPFSDAYSFPRKNFFHGKWIKHCDWWPDETVRLVRKNLGRFKNITHEKWVTEGKVAKLNTPIEHYSFRRYSDMLRVLENRTTAMAEELFKEGKRVNPLTPFIDGIFMFLKIYILKLGFLDGFDGFVIALSRAVGVFFKYAKLLELQRKK